MIEHRLFQNTSNGLIYEAVQYGHSNGTYTSDCITAVAAFITGLNPDISTSVANERILDVVRPRHDDWSVTNNKFPIEVCDWTLSEPMWFTVQLTDWVLKTLDHPFIFVTHEALVREFEEVIVKHVTKTELETEELARFIHKYELTSAIIDRDDSDDLAAAIIRAGWAKKEKE